MIVQIIGLVCLTTATAALILAPRTARREVLFDERADAPRPFGSEMSWIAVKTRDTTAVLKELQVSVVKKANWNSGIGAIYDPALSNALVFISPPIKGWTFVAGVLLPLPAGGAFLDKLTPVLVRLSEAFPDVQYFASFPTIDFFSWVRLDKGRLTRAFAISEAGIIWDRGKLTPEERSLGLRLFDLRGISGRRGDAGGSIILHPSEAHVLRLAKCWGMAPSELGAGLGRDGVGWIAEAPATWRSARLNKAA